MELSTATASGGAPSASSSSAAATSALSSDFDTFIRMLTAQMENQDPLNPIESADFATQLATFSGVEQQVKTNDLLAELGSQMSALGVSQLSGWIGLEGRAIAPVMFESDPVTLSLEGARLADRHEMVVRDTLGNELQRIEVSGARQEIAWQGRDANGNLLPAGEYKITVESFAQNELVATSEAEVHGRIVEATTKSGTTFLVMDTGQEVEASKILGLRQPT